MVPVKYKYKKIKEKILKTNNFFGLILLIFSSLIIISTMINKLIYLYIVLFKFIENYSWDHYVLVNFIKNTIAVT